MSVQTATKTQNRVDDAIKKLASRAMKETRRVTGAKEASRAVSSIDLPGILKEVFLSMLTDRKNLNDFKSIINSVESNKKEWLTTPEAAKKMGFSRTYVNALIKMGEFKDAVVISGGGHRRIKASAVEKWMHTHAVQNPLSAEQVALLQSSDPDEFFQERELSSEEAQRLYERREAGRKLSQFVIPSKQK